MSENTGLASQRSIYVLGSIILVLPLFGLALLSQFWPVDCLSCEESSSGLEWEKISHIFNSIEISLTENQRTIVLVSIVGFLGSMVHVANSFSSYVGAKKLDKNWIWWYLFRPVVGINISVIFYMVFRAGFFSSQIQIHEMNLYGVLTMAALVGLFSDRATLKLKEVFENLFKPKDEREGKLD